MTAESAVAGHSRQQVLREMMDIGLPLTAETYAVWREYRMGGDPRLRRAMDMMLGNGRAPDPVMLHRLYVQHCASRKEVAALQDVAARALATLDLVGGMLGNMQGAAAEFEQGLLAVSADMAVNAASGAAPMRPLMQRLATETHEMVRHSQTLVQRLNQSAERIDELEQFLTEARLEAATDKLTGLANRRAFDAALMAAAAAAMNSERPLAVLLADVDHFKKVNDTWGHEAGDDVLRLVAGALRQAVRGRDIVARHGGEEFAVILPETGTAGAMAVADNVRAAVSQCGLRVGPHNAELTVTISVGVSLYDAGEKLGRLIARVDSALYRAKQDGRNRTAVTHAAP